MSEKLNHRLNEMITGSIGSRVVVQSNALPVFPEFSGKSDIVGSIGDDQMLAEKMKRHVPTARNANEDQRIVRQDEVVATIERTRFQKVAKNFFQRQTQRRRRGQLRTTGNQRQLRIEETTFQRIDQRPRRERSQTIRKTIDEQIRRDGIVIDRILFEEMFGPFAQTRRKRNMTIDHHSQLTHCHTLSLLFSHSRLEERGNTFNDVILVSSRLVSPCSAGKTGTLILLLLQSKREVDLLPCSMFFSLNPFLPSLLLFSLFLCFRRSRALGGDPSSHSRRVSLVLGVLLFLSLELYFHLFQCRVSSRYSRLNLSLLRRVISFFNSQHFVYWLDFGTLLSALRQF